MQLQLLHLNDRQHKLVRWSLFTAIIVLWLYFGVQEHYFKTAIASLLQKLINFFDFPSLMDSSSGSSIGGGSEKGGRLVTFVFDFIYCALSLLIIHLYFLKENITKLAFGLYACMFVVCVLINETGKALDFEPFRVVAFRIMTIVISPLPIILLIPALYLNKSFKETATEALKENNVIEEETSY